MKHSVLFFTLAILFTNCKKDKITNTVKDRHVNCINNIETLVANELINFFKKDNNNVRHSEYIMNTRTDLQGNFSFIYTLQTIHQMPN
jgi:hypothetical protein